MTMVIAARAAATSDDRTPGDRTVRMAGLDGAEGGDGMALGEADDRTPGDRTVRMAGLDAAEGGDDVAIGRAAAAVDGGEDAPGLDDPCFF